MSMKKVRWLLLAVTFVYGSSAYSQVNIHKFKHVDVVCILGSFWQEPDAAKAKSSATEYMDKYLRTYVIPQLIEQGFEVKYIGISKSWAPVIDHGVLYADYSETQGPPYMPAGYGTNIAVTLRLFGPSSNEPIWSKILKAKTSSSVSLGRGGDLHTNARDNLEAEFKSLLLDFKKHLLK